MKILAVITDEWEDNGIEILIVPDNFDSNKKRNEYVDYLLSLNKDDHIIAYVNWLCKNGARRPMKNEIITTENILTYFLDITDKEGIERLRKED